MRILYDAVGLVFFGSTDGIGTELVDALRRKSKVTHYGYAGTQDALDGFKHLFATFKLDGVGTGLLHNAYGRGKSLLGVALIGSEGHIHDDESAIDGARHRRGVDNHLVERDWQRGFVAFHNVGSAVADQYDIDFCAVEELRHREVVGRKHSDFLAVQLHIL